MPSPAMPRQRIRRQGTHTALPKRASIALTRIFALLLWRKMGIFSHKNERAMPTQPNEKQALARIYGHGRGWAVSPVDFRDIDGWT